MAHHETVIEGLGKVVLSIRLSDKLNRYRAYRASNLLEFSALYKNGTP